MVVDWSKKQEAQQKLFPLGLLACDLRFFSNSLMIRKELRWNDSKRLVLQSQKKTPGNFEEKPYFTLDYKENRGFPVFFS